MTTTPTKATRSQQIAKCIEIVAKYFNVDPIKVMTAFSNPSKGISHARNLIWYHLHECGMAYHAIGRIWKLSETTIQKRARQGSIALSPEDILILKTLPRISTSLTISNTP